YAFEDGAQGNSDIYVAARSSTQNDFGPLTALATPNTASNEGDQYILPDGSALYFVSDRGGNYDIYRAPRSGQGFGAPALVNAVDVNGAAFEANPVVSPDELVIYFGSQRAGGSGDYDIYRASRASTSDAFGAAVNLSNLNTADIDIPS